MTKLSTFQIVLLAVFGALGIAGILIFALAVGQNDGEQWGSVEIWGTFPADAVSGVLQDAAEIDPRLQQVSYVEKDPAEYESIITDALAGGSGPDLFFLRQDYATKDAPKISPFPKEWLSRTDYQKTFVEATYPFSTSVGTLAIPLMVDPLVLYVNSDILNENGYAEPPAYWDEIQSMAERITVRNESGGIQKSTIAFGTAANIANAKAIVSTLILQAGGAITVQNDAGEIMPMLSGSGQDAGKAESALRYYTEFADPSKVDYTWNRSLPEGQRAFIAGDVALYVGFASGEGDIAAANPTLNFTIARLPQIRNGERQANVARVWGLAATRTSDNLSGAQAVASILGSTEVSRIFSRAFTLSSARRDVLREPAEGYADLFNRETLIARSWLDPDPQKTDVIFSAMIEHITSGSLRLSDAIQRANQEMAQIGQ